MRLYDSVIKESLKLLDGYKATHYKINEPVIDEKDLDTSSGINDINKPWPDAGDHNMVLKSEMSYELGGSGMAAISGLSFTSDATLVECDEVVVYGADINQISEDSSYARLTFLRVLEDGLGEGDEAYSTMRKVEYTRYHVNPKGYMMRISVANDREPVRISKQAIENGLDFQAVGQMFIKGYRENPKIKAAKIIFITLQDFSYEELGKKVHISEQITESLNHIFKDLKMDCSVCNLKSICDEVEGMRELHFAQGK